MNELQYYKSKSESLQKLVEHHEIWLYRDIKEFLTVDAINYRKLQEELQKEAVGKKVISGQT